MNTVTFDQVTKKRGNFSIDDLSFNIPEGYITGFIGPNGSGKTTVIQMLMDIVQPDEGSIDIFGHSYKNHENKQHIGFVYDDLYMYDDFTIKKMKSFIAPLYDNWNESLFEHYLQRFELPYKKRLKKFSKGMKMKCSLLFALAHEPDFLIMDEPTAGLDPIFRRELLELLQELMENDKQTIFFSTHITTDLDQISDQIILINKGKVLLEISTEELHERFHMIKGEKELLDTDTRELFIGMDETDLGFTALFEGNPQVLEEFDVIIEKITLEDFMYFYIKGNDCDATSLTS